MKFLYTFATIQHAFTLFSLVYVELFPLSLCSINPTHPPLTTTKTPIPTRRINESYKHNLSSEEITQSIQRHFDQSISEQQQKQRIEIDVSCSFLKDDGIAKVMDCILKKQESTLQTNETEEEINEAKTEKQEEAKSTDLSSSSQPKNNNEYISSISLEARMNRISTKGITSMLDQLISLGEERIRQHLMQSKHYDDNVNSNDDHKMEEEKVDNVTTSDNNNTTSTINGNETVGENDVSIKEEEESSIIDQTSYYYKNNIYVESIDVGLNDIGLHGVDTFNKKEEKMMMKFLHSIRKVIENKSGYICPTILRMDHCGLGPPSCRYIGKGIVNSIQHILEREIELEENEKSQNDKSNIEPYQPASNGRLRELYLSGNPIGESGTTALAAALKISQRIKSIDTNLPSSASGTTQHSETPTEKSPQTYQPVLDKLDISSCQVGDIGAEALALAIVHNPGCVNHLILSNNKITNRGAIALAKALRVSQQKMTIGKNFLNDYAIDTLDLSNNVDIEDDGAIALFEAVECGAIRNLLLRSCSITSDGVSSLGNILAQIIYSYNQQQRQATDVVAKAIEFMKEYNIDISGNKIGSKKSKKKSGYSEKMMKNVNSIGQKGFGLLKSGLKDIVDFGTSSLSSSSLESDDEAEEDDEDLVESKQSKVSDKCGAVALYDSFIECFDMDETEENDDVISSDDALGTVRICLGMRMCNFDDAALDALAALICHVEQHIPMKKLSLTVDSEMNHDIEEDLIQALKMRDHNEIIDEMTERHLEAIEFRRRTLEAKEAESRLNGIFENDDDYDDEDDNYDNQSNF